jgi:hypothetical protein
MLTGRTAAPVPGLSFYDAWEVAGPAAPRPGGAGHPTHTALLGTCAVNNTHPSDHYALQSSLRY